MLQLSHSQVRYAYFFQVKKGEVPKEGRGSKNEVENESTMWINHHGTISKTNVSLNTLQRYKSTCQVMLCRKINDAKNFLLRCKVSKSA